LGCRHRRHRYRALSELGIHVYSQIASFEETVRGTKELTEEQFIYDSNIHRRNLTPDQRVMLTAEFIPYLKQEAECRKAETQVKKAGPGKGNKTVRTESSEPFKPKRNHKIEDANSTVGQIASKAGVSFHKARQAKVLTEYAKQSPELAQKVINGIIPHPPLGY
jgi:hypothetical protein